MTAAITASDARKRLFPLIEQVNEDHTTIEIVSKHGNAVLVSKDDWDSMQETNYLMRGENGRRLMAAIADLEAGDAVEHDLIES